MVRWRALTSSVLLLLAGCDRENVGADGYAFGKPEFVNTEGVQVRVVVYENLTELRRALPPGNDQAGREVMAWGRILPAEPVCEVHIVDPARTYAPEWLGQELAHCIYGRWHP